MAPWCCCHYSHSNSDIDSRLGVENAARQAKEMVGSNEASNEFVGSSHSVEMDEVRCINDYEMRAMFVKYSKYSIDVLMILMGYGKLRVALLFASPMRR